MLKVTEAARNRLLSKLATHKAADNEAYRFMRKKGGWKLRIDAAQPDDKKLAHNGRDVLLLDDDVLRKMTKLTLDVSTAESKPRLTLRTVSSAKD